MSRSSRCVRGGRGARAALRPLPLLAAAVAVALAAGVPGVAARSKASSVAPWTLAFQISDLHFCAWGDEPWYASSFGDREGDAQLLANASTGLVRWLAPDVVLVTGDLTDGKQLGGTGTQQPSEWASYARFLRTLEGALPGVPLLDVRGNHDSFDVPYRGAPSDGYAGSTGAAFPAARVPIGALSEAREGRAVAPGEPQCRATLQRVAATALPPAPRGAWKRASGADPLAAQAAGAAAKAGCPSIVLLGVDVAPEPGLRSPANFAGRANETLLAEVRDALGRARPGDACPATPVLAYGHYPLSTVARHEAAELDPLVARDAAAAAAAGAKAPSWASELARLAGSPLAALAAPWRGGARVARAVLQSWHSTDGLLSELAAGGSDLYVSGHLHAAFGEALHAVHEVDVGRDGPDAPSRRRLVELEATSWKEDRRVRWLVADAASGAVSFVDAHFVPAANASGSAPGADPPFPAAGVPLTRRVGRRAEALADDAAWVAARELRGWGLAPASSPPGVWDSPARNLEHAARHVHATLAVIHPPDARYASSARGGAAVTSARGAVRVASWTLPRAPAGTAEAVALDAYWYPSGELALENVATTVAAAAASADGAGVRRLHEAVLGVSRADRDARGALGLAIRARTARGDGAAGAVEDAATAPVLVALECDDADCYVAAPGAAAVGRSAAAASFSPAPATTLLERFTLFVNWPVFAQRLFYLIWLAVVSVLLLAPKLALCVARRRGASRSVAAAATAAPGLEVGDAGRAPAAEQAGNAADAAARRPSCLRPALGCRVPRSASPCAVCSVALFPWRAAVAYASLRVRWALTVAWWAGLLLGPWTLAAAMTGAPYSLVFHVGEVGVLPGPSAHLADAGPGTPTPAFLLRFVPTQDTLFLALIELCAAHAPFLVWVQWVVAYRRQGALGPRWADPDAGKAAGADAAASACEGWDEDRRPLLASPSGRDLGTSAPGGDAPDAPRALRRLLGRLSSALPRALSTRVASPCRLLGVVALTLAYLVILLVNYLVMYRRLTPFLGKAVFASPGIVGAPFLALAFALVGPVVDGGSRRGVAPAQPRAVPRRAAPSAAQVGGSSRSPGKAD